MASELKTSPQQRMIPSLHYMDIQTRENWAMRSTLIDWIVRAHERLVLGPEELFLAVHYADQFLSRKINPNHTLQLVGVTAVIIAAKYEGTEDFTIEEVLSFADGRYTVDEVIQAERVILNVLDYELGWPGALFFLNRISRADDYDLDTQMLQYYNQLLIGGNNDGHRIAEQPP